MDEQRKIAYVWYGLFSLSVATRIDCLEKVQFGNKNKQQITPDLENYELLEMILLNHDYLSDGQHYYEKAIHNVIMEYNQSAKEPCNELDVLLTIQSYPDFAKSISYINQKTVEDYQKEEKERRES